MRTILATALLGAALLLASCAGPKRLPPAATDPATRPPVPPPVPQLLGVGIAEEQDELVLTADGPALLLDGRQRRLLARVAPGRSVTCWRGAGGVGWRTADASGQASTVIFQVDDPGHRVRHADAGYRGEFLVIPAPAGPGLTLVNHVALEDYLRGVVPWEIGRHGCDALAAVEAQAVAARTYTVSHLGARRARGFDVFASVMDQVYRGADGEDALCNEAVARTAGLVLRHGGEEITAYYSANCGGVSSNVEEVWAHAARPYLTSRKDGPRDGRGWCQEYKHFRWEETWTRVHLEELLAAKLPEYLAYVERGSRAAWAGAAFTRGDGHGNRARPGGLRDLVIRERTTSGRVARLDVVTEAGTYHVRGDRVRWILPPPGGHPAILRSALFDLDLTRRDGRIVTVRARGRGYGHGIGMCQTGALGMARRGRDVTAILEHYYPGASLVRLGGSPAP